MAQSVSGKIRIDVLSNVAGFNSGMKSAARDGLGGFAQEYERTAGRVRKSQKTIAAGIDRDKAAWGSAMKELRGDVSRPGKSMLPWYSMERMNPRHDPALQRHIRLRSQLPFGMSTTTSLSGQQASSAARMGAAGRGGIGGGMASMLGDRLGIRGMVNPVTIGLGAASAAAVKVTRDLLRTAEAERQIVLQADKLGLGVKQFNDLNRVAVLTGSSVAQVGTAVRSMNRRIAEASAGNQLYNKALVDLGLNAKELMGMTPEKAFESIAAEIAKIPNQMERARIEMNLFSESGRDLDALIRRLAKDRDDISASELSEGEIESLAAFGADWEAFTHKIGTGYKTFLAQISYGIQQTFGMDTRLSEETDEAAEAQLRLAEAAKAYADNLKEAQKPLVEIENRLHSLIFGSEAIARAKFIQGLDEKGINGFERSQSIKDYDRAVEETGQTKDMHNRLRSEADERRRLRESVLTPEEKLAATQKRTEKLFGNPSAGKIAVEQEEIASLRKLYGEHLTHEELLHRIKMKNLREYYREVHDLDADRLARSLESPLDAFNRRVDSLRSGRDAGVITPGLADRAATKDAGDYRKSVGIADPLGDFTRSLKDLNDARDRLKGSKFAISDEDYNTRRDDLRKSAVSAMMSDNQGVSPIGAMEHGSMAAHQLIANAMVASPQLAEAKKANAILERIERNTREQPEAVGEPLTF